jgi:hypothetical protein
VERVLAVGSPGGLGDQAHALERSQRRGEVGLTRHGSQDRLGERAADHRGELQRVLAVLVEGVQARGEQRLQGVGIAISSCSATATATSSTNNGLPSVRSRIWVRTSGSPSGDQRVDQPTAVVVRERLERELARAVRVLGLEPLLEAPGLRLPVRAVGEQEQARQFVHEPRASRSARPLRPRRTNAGPRTPAAAARRPRTPRRGGHQLQDRVAERLPSSGSSPGSVTPNSDRHTRMCGSSQSSSEPGSIVAASFRRTSSGGSVSLDPGEPGQHAPVLRVRPRRVIGDALPGLPEAMDLAADA